MKKADWQTIHRHLARDPVMRDIMLAVGPCTLRPRRDHFVLLCKSIYSQQISTAAAAVLFGRFRECFPRKRPTPQRVLDLLNNGNPLPACGLSRQKRSYLIDLARHFLSGALPNRRLPSMSDEEIIQALTAVKGIGRWTAEMFLIFTLNRLDVLPVDDLGLQKSVRGAYGLKHLPKAVELKALAGRWQPYRSIATWYLWRAAEAADGGW
jgi:DNA-3-methyladenine glycosylase II